MQYQQRIKLPKQQLMYYIENLLSDMENSARLHSDQGTNFESQLIKELCDLMGIKKSRTTPYHAAGNGMTERFNQTLISMLGTLEIDKKKNWKQFLHPLYMHTIASDMRVQDILHINYFLEESQGYT